jgi:hypothetical protein
MGLKHRRRAVDIDHKPGQEVAFAVDEAVGCIVGAHKTEGLAEAESFLKASAIEVGVDRLAFAECEHSHGYGADLKMSCAYDSAVGGFDAHEVAFFDTGILAGHLDKSAGEDPRVEAVKRLFLAATEFQYREFHVFRALFISVNIGKGHCRWHRGGEGEGMRSPPYWRFRGNGRMVFGV